MTMPASAHGAGDTVKPNFDHPVTDIPGNSLIAVAVALTTPIKRQDERSQRPSG